MPLFHLISRKNLFFCFCGSGCPGCVFWFWARFLARRALFERECFAREGFLDLVGCEGVFFAVMGDDDEGAVWIKLMAEGLAGCEDRRDFRIVDV